jgi:hypothetical protein
MINVDPRRPKGIVWIASYPKSGNTWMRMFLYQLMRILGGHPREADELNKLDRSSMYEARLYNLFDQSLGKPLKSATRIEVTKAREKVHATIAERVENVALVKTHNVLGHINGMPILNPKVSVGAIYVVRDPRDVAPSLASHLGSSLDEAIRVLGLNGYSTRNTDESAFETWGSWSEHVVGWTMTPSDSILVVRYEDMQDKPLETFTAVARHLGQNPAPEQIAEAAELSTFDSLKGQEERYDFRERSPKADRFFVSGKTGGWREKLTEAQVAAITEAHGPQMRKFGYVD